MKSGQRVVKKLLNTKYNVSEMWNEAGKNPITGGFREKFDNLKMILVEKKFSSRFIFTNRSWPSMIITWWLHRREIQLHQQT